MLPALSPQPSQHLTGRVLVLVGSGIVVVVVIVGSSPLAWRSRFALDGAGASSLSVYTTLYGIS